MRNVVIIQARMTSTRLPGKVLMDITGRPMLCHQLDRLKKCTMVDSIVIATTVNTSDDVIVRTACQEGVDYFRGSERDVLGRYIGAARRAKADVVVRITADCPLMDPEVVDLMISTLLKDKTGCDYVSNIIQRTYPRGLDVEALYFDTLVRLDRLGKSKADREHVTLLMRSGYPDLFIRRSITDSTNNSDLRLTVDRSEDLELIRTLFEKLNLRNDHLSYRDIVAYLRQHPELIEINSHVETWEPAQPVFRKP
ncbi:MAG: glycosyltransferase family protein [Pseudomonadota bacterium]